MVAPVVVAAMPVTIEPVAAMPMQSRPPVTQTPPPPPPVVATSPIEIPWMQIIAGAWIGGTIVYLALAWLRFRSFRRLITQEQQAGEVLDDVKSLAAKMNIRPPRVVVTEAAVSPMVLILNRAATLIVPLRLLRTLDPQHDSNRWGL